MSFSINTNIASLQAQNYLRINENFQNQTINEVTSGLRIVNAGDDAAGLAVANGMASEEAVLTQGIQNASQGLNQLQIADGGMSNISQLLNRAQTLATESASGTFTGDRSVLNNEFQSVLSEINRQAQSIGLNAGGAFAKNLTVFIGGGKDQTGGTADAGSIANGSVSVDLSNSAVDTKSLGLTSYGTTGSASTSLATITAGTTSGNVDLKFYGAGFATGVTVTAAGVNNATSLSDVVNDINAAISTTANSGSDAAFAAAGIQAQVNSAGTGIVFTSATGGFAVSDGTNGTAAAKNILGTTDATPVFAQGTQQVALDYAADVGAGETQNLTISAVDASGNLQTVNVNLSGATTEAQAMAAINTALQGASSPVLQNLVAVQGDATSNGQVIITGTGNFNVFVGTEEANGDGFEIGATGAGGQGANVASSLSGSAGALDVSTAADAQLAINALTNAVTNLGNSQATVGRGENQFNYAINLAQSQLTNTQAAESTIRDADLAAESANLTKAQILIQAGVAALAQANSAPQQLLSLLQHS